MTGDAVSRGAVVVTTIVAVGALTPTDFGRYVSLQAAALFVALIWDAGASQLLTRELAAGHIDRQSALEKVLAWRAKSILIPACGLVGGLLLIYHDFPSFGVLLTLFAYMLCQNGQQVLTSALRGEMDFWGASVAASAGRLTTMSLSLGIWAVADNATVALMFAALAVGEFISGFVAEVMLRRRHRVTTRRRSSRFSFRAGLPFSLSGVLITAYNRLDIIIVAAVASTSVVSAYAPASRLQDALLIAPLAVSSVLFPMLARSDAKASSNQGLRTFMIGTSVSVVGSLVVAAGAFAVVGPVVEAWAPSYQSSIDPCRIVVWSLPLVALNASLMSLMNARGGAHLVPWGIGAAFLTSIAVNVTLVPRLGADGAAIAATVREIPSIIIFVVLARGAGILSASRC